MDIVLRSVQTLILNMKFQYKFPPLNWDIADSALNSNQSKNLYT